MKFEVFDHVTKEQLDMLQNKKVCNVTEMIMPSIAGSYKGWCGSTEDAYFSIVFVRGIMTVSLEEREMCLGWNPINFAAIDVLADAGKGKATEAKNAIIDEYTTRLYLDDVSLIKFSDVMKPLKWKMKSRSVKVEDHFMNDPLTIQGSLL